MLPRDLQEIARHEGMKLAPENAAAVAAWVAAAPAARPYLFYLKWMYETFHAIAECFPRDNSDPTRAHEKDAAAQATSPEEMLHLADHLYRLQSSGVAGAVLECGCFKGFSTACLSHACDALGRELIVADSFQGLPEPRADEGWYQPGDFRGTLAEVEANVRTYGKPAAVRYREGWFRESLAGWSRPLALLWLDVDLYDSTRDVLENVLPSLDPRGALFSHEVLPEHIRDGALVHRAEPPGALHDVLSARGITYQATHLCGQTAVLTFPSPAAADLGAPAGALLTALLPHLRDADHRARAARQAIGLRPALRDLAKRARARVGSGRE